MQKEKEIRDAENCCWGERIEPSQFYWCSLNNTPCRYATRCNFEKREEEKE